MKQIETKIRIESGARIVWQILMDFEDYPNWNPFVIKISGNTPSASGSATVGENIDVVIFNGKKNFNFKPKVLVLNQEQEFRWKGGAAYQRAL